MEEDTVQHGLSDIRRRIIDCYSYKFGLWNADTLAHHDAPLMMRALLTILDLCATSESHAEESGDTASVYVDDIRLAVAEMFK